VDLPDIDGGRGVNAAVRSLFTRREKVNGTNEESD